MNSDNNKYIKMDEWLRDIVVDPLSKEALTFADNGEYLVSPYGRQYPIVKGVFDLRLLNNETTNDQKIWKKGQCEYEKMSMLNSSSDNTNYEDEFAGIKDVYREIPIEGSCLDVGGNMGRLRAFIDSGQRYVTCDPFLNVFDSISERPRLVEAYPFLLEPVNFLACDAEFLPFKSCSFQVVHMRSVIDHFLNPELALNEAYRVLDDDGSIIVGLYVHGGKDGKESVKEHVKEAVRSVLPYFGVHRFTDHHVWHPTYIELIELISMCGFEVTKVYWQEQHSDTVCYIKASKKIGLIRGGV